MPRRRVSVRTAPGRSKPSLTRLPSRSEANPGRPVTGTSASAKHATHTAKVEHETKGDLEVVEAEFTLVGVNPALDQVKEMAAALRGDAKEHARLSGRRLGASTQRTSVR